MFACLYGNASLVHHAVITPLAKERLIKGGSDDLHGRRRSNSERNIIAAANIIVRYCRRGGFPLVFIHHQCSGIKPDDGCGRNLEAWPGTQQEARINLGYGIILLLYKCFPAQPVVQFAIIAQVRKCIIEKTLVCYLQEVGAGQQEP